MGNVQPLNARNRATQRDETHLFALGLWTHLRKSAAPSVKMELMVRECASTANALAAPISRLVTPARSPLSTLAALLYDSARNI